MAQLEWTTSTSPESSFVAQMNLPCFVKVEGETGGVWLFFDTANGPAFAWLPNTEHVAQALRPVWQQFTATQDWFDGVTNPSLWGHFQIAHGKP